MAFRRCPSASSWPPAASAAPASNSMPRRQARLSAPPAAGPLRSRRRSWRTARTGRACADRPRSTSYVSAGCGASPTGTSSPARPQARGRRGADRSGQRTSGPAPPPPSRRRSRTRPGRSAREISRVRGRACATWASDPAQPAGISTGSAASPARCEGLSCSRRRGIPSCRLLESAAVGPDCGRPILGAVASHGQAASDVEAYGSEGSAGRTVPASTTNLAIRSRNERSICPGSEVVMNDCS